MPVKVEYTNEEVAVSQILTMVFFDMITGRRQKTLLFFGHTSNS